MKPDWDKLSDEFAGSPTRGIFDVDCTFEKNKGLCEEKKVTGYPTLKWGDPNNLQDYEGGRSFDELTKFVNENLGPVCDPKNLDLCDAKVRAMIEGFMALPKAELAKKASTIEKAITGKEKDWNKRYRKFDAKYAEFFDEMGEENEVQRLASEIKVDKKKLSKTELARYEKNQKQAKLKQEKLQKRQDALNEQRDKFSKEKSDLDAEKKETGLKFMKMLIEDKKGEEL